MSSVFQLKVKASKLPKYKIFKPPNCYVDITIDGGHTLTTKAVKGSSPEWNESFEISLQESSTIKIQLFHVPSSGKKVLRGSTEIPVKNVLPQENNGITREHKLHGTKFHKAGSVVITLCRKLDLASSDVSANNMDSKAGSTPIVATQKASGPSSSAEKESGLQAELRRAEAALIGQGYDGTVMDSITAVTSSELLGTVLGYVEKIVVIGDVISNVHPYAQMAWNVLTVVHKALQAQEIRNDKIRGLFVTIRDMLDFTKNSDAVSKITKLQTTVSAMMEEIRMCALFIQEYGERGFGKRVLQDNLSTTTDNRIEEFVTKFTELKQKFDRGISVETFNTVYHLAVKLEGLDAAETERLLERLPGWNLPGVMFNPYNACYNGTRKQLLDDIYTWAHSPDQSRILWLQGGAGTGKTSVAHSTAVHFERLGCLGGCFFFSRDSAERNKPDNLFGNLSFQLAHFAQRGQFQLKQEILSAIRLMGGGASLSLRTQAEKLIVNTTIAAELVGPVVVIIDALDESGPPRKRDEILKAITGEFPRLPRSVKVLITSRDELDICAALRDCSEEICIDNAENTGEDIVSYIQGRLVEVQRKSFVRHGWPEFEKVQELANRAGGLFIWASVACNFIEEKRDPALWLNRLLNVTTSINGAAHSPLTKLDHLYESILKDTFPEEDDPLTDYHYIFGSIVVLETPLTQTGLDSLLGLGDDGEGDPSVLQSDYDIQSSSGRIISSLRSILRADQQGTGHHTGKKDGPVRLLHPSLHEYLTTRANDHFQINPSEQNHTLAYRCLILMNSHLHYDICKIGKPYLLNNEIEDLSQKIKECTSEGLCYACHAFGYHLAGVPDPDATLQGALREFLSEHLLHWIEVMSLFGEISKAEHLLHGLSCWVKKNSSKEIQRLVDDAIPFLRACGTGIRLSALHTYYSALPLTPQKSDLFNHFISKYPHLPRINSSHPVWPTASVRVLEGHMDMVIHVAFSPDGKKIASGCGDGTLQLWDVESGQPIGEALSGHTAWVTNVAFSPDGKKLVSASDDNTLQLWDVESGQPIGGALLGHTDQVKRVAFSPDGKKLASASFDNTSRLWDVESGQSRGKPLSGHTGHVKHVAFSPDGKKLASASDDKTLRLWDVESGQQVGEALSGHTGWVDHVAFSPDGKKLASASQDKTLRLWDVESGQPIGDSLSGHTGWIKHVVFSPDGKKLASASYDKTLRLWDVESHHPIGEALTGHAGAVINSAFSPDGKRLASASYDNTLRLWTVESGQPIGEALSGHTDWVNYVAFSPDGKKLASAADDKTLRLWDVESGQAIREAQSGHTGWIDHIAFSPDGTKLASASKDMTLRLWNVESGRPIREALSGHTGWVNHVGFSPDGNKLASVSDDNTLQLWDVMSVQAIGNALSGHTRQIKHAAFSPDGKTLASASDDHTIQLWDVEDGQAIGQALSGHTGWVNHVAFSPDGLKLASASYDMTLQLWDVQSGKVIGDALSGHIDTVLHVAFSPDGKKLASASYDKTVRLWDVKTGQAIGDALSGHMDWVRHVAFSPDGKILCSASNDNTLRLWDVESGQPIGEALSSYTHTVNQVPSSPEETQLPPTLYPHSPQLSDIAAHQATTPLYNNFNSLSSQNAVPQLAMTDITSNSWLQFFTTPTASEFQEALDALSSFIDEMAPFTMSFDHQGFLLHGTRRLTWLPVPLRGSVFAAWGQLSSVAVGCENGALTIIRFFGSTNSRL